MTGGPVALTQRGKVAISVGAAAIVVVLAVLAFTGNAPDPIQGIVDSVTDKPEPCPLTGEFRAGGKATPVRPPLSVKVENSDDAYPLAGLERADVIYEEPVEGGITRFAALFQCHDASRVGPVRSARTTDPRILRQYSDEPLLAYSGANPKVTAALDEAGVVSLTETSAADAFVRDDSRSAPHNLFVSTKKLYQLAERTVDFSLPEAVFRFDEEVPTPSKPRTSASVAFSSSNVVGWAWSEDRWVRELDGEPMTAENGDVIAADNVVIQEVVVTDSDIVDVAGFPSPDVKLTGRGRAWILRDGRLVIGRWRRGSLDDVTAFETRGGEEIGLAPGTTFIQLVPRDDGAVSFER
jgi:Protein of unknown function (DUF3048) N-terminal domain/Protein of unknown function (DUF3048) C-terminal domain